jgi:methylmalonyl-CoA mutase cobalamin-binding subunit
MTVGLRCLLVTVESDSHMWNLTYIQKVLEEQGVVVRNLGCCTPVDHVVHQVKQWRPDVVVLSTINGHGYHGVRVLLERLQAAGSAVPLVVGGRLSTTVADDTRIHADLLARGCAGVFVREGAVDRLRALIGRAAAEGIVSRPPDGAGRLAEHSEFGEEGDLACTS